MKRALLRLEALWWMARPPSFPSAFVAVPGWLAAERGADLRLLALVAAMMIGRGLANILNDLLDREKDGITAPELPLPCGLLTARQALRGGAILAVLMLALLASAGDGLAGFALGLAGLIGGGLLIVLYSFAKPLAFLAVLVTGLIYLTAAVTAWLVAGPAWSRVTAVVFVYALLSGVAANIFSTLRDIDRDGMVGNRSIALRLGSTRALQAGLGVEFAATACVLGVGLVLDRPLLGVLTFGASSGLLLAGYRATATGHLTAGTREQRSRLMRVTSLSRTHGGIVFVQSPLSGIVVFACTALAALPLNSLYEKRIIDGGLRADLDGAKANGRSEPLLTDRT